MTKISTRLAALAATIAVASAPLALSAKDDSNARGEAELAKILKGRVAGEPVNCLSEYQRNRLQVVDHTAFVYRDGKTIWVNRPNGADFLSWGDLPVFKQYSSQLCRLDQVELRDRGTMMPGPVLTMQEFVPYRLPDDAHPAEGG